MIIYYTHFSHLKFIAESEDYVVKITKPPEDSRFIETLPAGLTGTCSVCRCGVETEGNERNDQQEARWYTSEEPADGKTFRCWQVKCPTPNCSGWISVS
jgi:hypothetical protein